MILRRLLVSSMMLAIVLSTMACARMERRNLAPLNTPTMEKGTGYAPGDYFEELTVADEVRHYRLHIPPSYKPNQPLPLVINLHGLNSNAAQQEQVSQMSVKADQMGFVVVYPEGRGQPQTWYIGPGAEGAADLQFMHDLVTHLQGQLSLDPTRIYATGMSNGAQMSNRLGCTMADVFAAIAPVSGGYPTLDNCHPTQPVPVVAFHGTADKLLPYQGQGRLLLPVPDWAAAWATRNGCEATPSTTFHQGEVTGQTWSHCQANADVVLYTIQGRGHSWPGSSMPPDITTQDINATDVIWEFFAAHPMR
ncbi:MAG: prolyl oligopeptidase family serine peptidase [Anaerolineae bacterium]|nr:prolyl oligopeptidase family serine peptidase [Anaerolineae bacterium]